MYTRVMGVSRIKRSLSASTRAVRTDTPQLQKPIARDALPCNRAMTSECSAHDSATGWRRGNLGSAVGWNGGILASEPVQEKNEIERRAHSSAWISGVRCPFPYLW